MNCVSPKIAIEVLMRFQQRHGYPFAGEEQRQNRPCRATPDHAAVGCYGVQNFILCR